MQRAWGNGIKSNILRCNTKLCQLQLGFNPFDKVVSSATKRMYDYARRVIRGGGGGGLLCPFLKTGKKCPNLEKNVKIVVI